MRNFALAVAAAMLCAVAAPALAQGIQIGPGGIQLEPQYRGRSVGREACDELRRACLYEQELGEEGEGNCRKYRRQCRNQ